MFTFVTMFLIENKFMIYIISDILAINIFVLNCTYCINLLWPYTVINKLNLNINEYTTSDRNN